MPYATRHHAFVPPTTWTIDASSLRIADERQQPVPRRIVPLTSIASARVEISPTRPTPTPRSAPGARKLTMEKRVLTKLVGAMAAMTVAMAAEAPVKLSFPAALTTSEEAMAVMDNGEARWSRDGRTFVAVPDGGARVSALAFVPGRLLVARATGVSEYALDGSGTSVRHEAVKDVGFFVQGPEAVLAVAEKGGIFRRAPEGSWSSVGRPEGGRLVRGVRHSRGWLIGGAEGAPNETGAIWHSADGAAWTRVARIESGPVASMAGGAAGLLAVTAKGEGWFSPDGRAWERRTLPLQKDETAVARFLAGEFWLDVDDEDGRTRLLRSTDAATWREEKPAHAVILRGLGERGGKVVLLAKRELFLPFEVASLETFATPWQPPVRVVALPQAKLAPGATLRGAWAIATQEGDEIDFTKTPLGRMRSDGSGGVVGVAGKHVLIGTEPGNLRALKPGINFEPIDVVIAAGTQPAKDRWTLLGRQHVATLSGRNVSSVAAGAEYRALAPFRGGAMAVGTKGTVNGFWGGSRHTWIRTEALGEMRSAAANADIVVAVGAASDAPGRLGGGVFQGNAWTAYRTMNDLSNLPAMNEVIHTGTEFVAVGAKGLVLRSTNGLAWKERRLAGEPELTRVAAHAGRLVVTTATGAVLRERGDGNWVAVAEGGAKWAGFWSFGGGPLEAYTADGVSVQELVRDDGPETGAVIASDDPAAERRRLAAERQAVAEAKSRAEREQRATAVAAAVVNFEREFHAATRVRDAARPVADFIVTLEKIGASSLADSVVAGAVKFFELHGGAIGYLSLRQALPGSRSLTLGRYLTPAAAAEAAKLGASVPGELATRWPERARGERGPQKGASLDLERVRRRLVTHPTGAAFDLSSARGSGIETELDRSLFEFWREVAFASRPGSREAIQKSGKSEQVLFDAESAVGLSIRLRDELEKLPRGPLPEALVPLARRAADAGSRDAARMIEQLENLKKLVASQARALGEANAIGLSTDRAVADANARIAAITGTEPRPNTARPRLAEINAAFLMSQAERIARLVRAGNVEQVLAFPPEGVDVKSMTFRQLLSASTNLPVADLEPLMNDALKAIEREVDGLLRATGPPATTPRR